MRRRTNTITLAEIPAVGLSILIDGQRFDLVGHEPHRSEAGEETTLLVWLGECAECGAPFTARTSATRWAETRRCKAHRAPGRPVKRLTHSGDADRPERTLP